MYYVTFLRMSHFLWCRYTGGGQGRFWQGFGFSVRRGLVGRGSGFLDLHGFSLLRKLMFPSAVCLPYFGPVTMGVLPRGSFGTVTAGYGCEGAGPELVAALAGSAKPGRHDGDAGVGQEHRGCPLHVSLSSPLTLSHRPRHGREPARWLTSICLGWSASEIPSSARAAPSCSPFCGPAAPDRRFVVVCDPG